MLSRSVMSDSLRTHDVVQLARLLCAWDSPSKNPGVGCHSLLQGTFLTQGSNLRLSCLLHWQEDSLPLSHRGRPLNLFTAMCTEDAGVPRIQTGQQHPPQSGSALANKVLTQPRGTDNDCTRIGSKAFSSSVTPTTFQVLRSIMWPGAMVLDRADV